MRLIIIDDKNRLESIFESPDMFKKDKSFLKTFQDQFHKAIENKSTIIFVPDNSNDKCNQFISSKKNINDFVGVKLTKHGFNILNDWIDKCNLELSRITNKRNITLEGLINKDKYTKFQLWSLMSIFGQHMYHGCETLFEDNEIEFL